jgi:hypothetical protein
VRGPIDAPDRQALAAQCGLDRARIELRVQPQACASRGAGRRRLVAVALHQRGRAGEQRIGFRRQRARADHAHQDDGQRLLQRRIARREGLVGDVHARLIEPAHRHGRRRQRGEKQHGPDDDAGEAALEHHDSSGISGGFLQLFRAAPAAATIP